MHSLTIVLVDSELHVYSSHHCFKLELQNYDSQIIQNYRREWNQLELGFEARIESNGGIRITVTPSRDCAAFI